MSLKTDSFVTIAARLRQAAEKFAAVAELVDVAAVAPPRGLVSHSADGVNRPVEDLVLAREDSGLYTATDRTRRHAAQAVLHAEEAQRCATRAVRAFDRT
ncbi:hypothetical protein [Amycolatopsis sp. lyj-23]|uniref:hypothetical protein n=1 Tax=Amycolatopsis sp. lyj-23 TaxID=2789283 RepID=UPI00397E47BB